ncbi:MAG: polyamine aminopropyltransferase [Nanoarchaeota archaeon]|nr:polyamine aminopropyltransferase [Nanoarchaeota archaeon]
MTQLVTTVKDRMMFRWSIKFNWASFLLISCMFATGACGLVLEFIQSTVGTYIFGNSIEQYSITMGLMLFMMGVAAKLQKYFSDRNLIEIFIGIEILLAIIGGYSPIATYWAYGIMEAHVKLVQYFFIMSLGLLIGLEIPVVMRINEKYYKKLSLNIEKVFSADYIGALLGTFLWVYYLLRRFPLTEISFILAGVNFGVAVVTAIYFIHKNMIAKKLTIIILMIFTAISLFIGYNHNRNWNKLLEQHLYDDPIVFSTTTKYQHLVMTHSRAIDEYRFFINSNLQFCSTDEERYHEPLVHPVMNLVSSHKRVLILGGGDGMALREVLKYPDVEEVLLVDLDPAMTQFCSQNPILRKLNQNSFKDARVVTMIGHGITTDGSKPIYMETGIISKDKEKQNKVEKIADVAILNLDADKFLSEVRGKWNVIIIDFPDPSGIELAKLYSKEFYLKLRRILAEHGMIVVQSTSPYYARESYLCIMRTMEDAGFNTLPFHENVPSFGDWGWFIAWKNNFSKNAVVRQIEELDFNVSTKYLTPDVFRRALVFGKNELVSKYNEVNTLMYPILLHYYLKESWLTD